MLIWLYARARWVRMTIRRYGWLAVFTKSRPRHAGVGRARKSSEWARAHGASTGWNITTGDIQAMMDAERERSS